MDKSVINSLLSNQNYAQITLEVQEKSGEASAKRVAHWFASALTASDESDAQTDNESIRVAVDDLIELAEMTEKSEVPARMRRSYSMSFWLARKIRVSLPKRRICCRFLMNRRLLQSLTKF